MQFEYADGELFNVLHVHRTCDNHTSTQSFIQQNLLSCHCTIHRNRISDNVTSHFNLDRMFEMKFEYDVALIRLGRYFCHVIYAKSLTNYTLAHQRRQHDKNEFLKIAETHISRIEKTWSSFVCKYASRVISWKNQGTHATFLRFIHIKIWQEHKFNIEKSVHVL